MGRKHAAYVMSSKALTSSARREVAARDSKDPLYHQSVRNDVENQQLINDLAYREYREDPEG